MAGSSHWAAHTYEPWEIGASRSIPVSLDCTYAHIQIWRAYPLQRIRSVSAKPTSFTQFIQLSLAKPNPSVPWKIVRYIQRFGIEAVPSPGKIVTSPGRTVRYIQRFGIEGVRCSERQLYFSWCAIRCTTLSVLSEALSHDLQCGICYEHSVTRLSKGWIIDVNQFITHCP